MPIETKKIEYTHGDTLLEGVMAWDSSQTEPKPGILVAHAWAGRDDFACDKAQELAKLGYVGFALDMYGKGLKGNSTEENSNLMNPLLQNRQLLQARMQLALRVASEQAEVDSTQMGAMGYCFGGLCVLDLARSAAELKGVVSFHAILSPPDNLEAGKIKSNVLVLHGYKDGMSKPEDLATIQTELAASEIDWQTHCYGQAHHAFTNPEAHDQELGLIYNQKSAQRAWQAMTGFWQDCF